MALVRRFIASLKGSLRLLWRDELHFPQDAPSLSVLVMVVESAVTEAPMGVPLCEMW